MQSLTEAQQTLVEENIRLAYYMAQKWSKHLPPQKADLEELKSLCSLALCKAARAFNEEKGVKFATFAARCMDNEVLMMLRREKNQWMLVSLEHPINDDGEGSELTIQDVLHEPKDEIEEWVINESIPALFSVLKEREEVLIKRIFFDNDVQRMIGIDMGLSQSYVSRVRDKALTKMRREAMRDQVAWF